jgi:hypothetical protein
VDDEEFGREWERLLARPQWSADAAEEGGDLERLPPGLTGCGSYGPVLVGPGAGKAGDKKGG